MKAGDRGKVRDAAGPCQNGALLSTVLLTSLKPPGNVLCRKQPSSGRDMRTQKSCLQKKEEEQTQLSETEEQKQNTRMEMTGWFWEVRPHSGTPQDLCNKDSHWTR